MRRSRSCIWFVVLAIVSVLASGCSERAEDAASEDQGSQGESVEPSVEPSTEAGTQQGGSETPSFAAVLASWRAGAEDEAVKGFLAIDWADSSAFADVPFLTMSEEQFRGLPEGDRTGVLSDGMELTAAMRKLVFHLVSVGQDLAASGDKDAAGRYLAVIHRYGKALSEPQRLELIRLHGQAVVQYADKHLSGVE